jgi:beta-glucosidase-like glycosyl hydrolase
VFAALQRIPRPAAFSERWVTDELRGRLKFDGVAITDDLQTPAARRVLSWRVALAERRAP